MARQDSERPFGFSQNGLEQVEFGFLLSDALSIINFRLDAAMATVGLTQSQWRVLVQVFRLDRPTQSELARAIGIGRASLGALVDQLANAGYLAREPDGKDRRIWRIIPTENAMRKSVEIRQLTETTLSYLFAEVDKQKMHVAKTVLRQLATSAVSAK